MAMPEPLCDLPPEPTGGCCDPLILPPTAPILPYNPPGLSAIRYRIGTFTNFRRAMLDEVARPDLLAFLGIPLNPFSGWHERIDGDYQTMFVELWAYLADILTFYQERIANEAYLPTATQRDSLLRLARLIDYRPSPGAGASALLAFTVEKKKQVSIPAGFRVGSKAAPGKPAATFEVKKAISAQGDYSAIPLSQVRPVDQFAALSGTTRSVVLEGINSRLNADEYVLIVENEGQPTENEMLRQIISVNADKTANTTTLTWIEPAGTSYSNVTLYAMRVLAAPFGANAPNWKTLPPSLNGTVNNVAGPYKDTPWDGKAVDPWAYLPTPGDPLNVVYLDATHNEAKGTADHPGWSVLLTDDKTRPLAGNAALVTATNADGRLEVFAVAPDRSLWHIWEWTPGGAWSGWAPLGGVLRTPATLAVGRNADGRLEVFAVGLDSALWHTWQWTPGGAWSGWASLGGVLPNPTTLAVANNADGRLEVFAVGLDSSIWHIWQTVPSNGWSGWASLGGVLPSPPTLIVGQNEDGRLELFAVGLDRAVWHIWQVAPNDVWSGWASLGGVLPDPATLVVGTNEDGRLEVFAIGLHNALWHIWQYAPNNGWSGWDSLDGVISGLALGNNADGRLELFARGTDGAVWHIWQTLPNNGWSGWTSLNDMVPDPPSLAAGTTSDGRLIVFTVGMDGTVRNNAQTAPNNGWAGWSSLGGPPRSSADIASIFHLTDARPISKTAYTTTTRATRLTFRESLPLMLFPFRNTNILIGSDALAVAGELPYLDPLGGNTLLLSGLYPHLQDGQAVIVRGNLYDPTTIPPSRTIGAESVTLAGSPMLDQANNLTTVTLKQSLTNQYVRASAVVLANIAEATQGETVRDELLGSGDGSALQSFALKQKPLTYLPATDTEGLASVESTLLVTVNGIRWEEQATLLENPPNARVFTTSQDDTSQTTISFGDGIHGARPPTGKDNIHARYRKGLGAGGNVLADGIQQLIDSIPGVQKVTNPQPAFGGADAENISQIRSNAPASLRTFGRAVSAEDYAALALSYPGVAKASAAWMLRDPISLQAISHPYIQLTVAAANRVPLAQQPTFAHQLRAFLDRRRDPNMPLRIGDFKPVYINFAAHVEIQENYPHLATLAAAQAALNAGLNPDGTPGYFAFERLEFGQSIHLSAVYAALQAVPGVKDATITTLRRLDVFAHPFTFFIWHWSGFRVSPVQNDIFIRPTELAVIKNDPQDTSNHYGKVTITGTGGFVDV